MKKKDPVKITKQSQLAAKATQQAKAAARKLADRERRAAIKAAKAAAAETRANSYRLTSEEFASYQGTIGAIEAKMGGLDKVAHALSIGLRTLRDRLKKIDFVRKEHLLAANALRGMVKA